MISKSAVSFSLILSLSGCMPSLSDQTKKSDKSIIGKTTQDIGEFDPKAKNNVSDGKAQITDPVTAPLATYGPALEKISKTTIEHALNFFKAENDRFPSDHQEFMEKIIKANQINLPVLPLSKKYQYDVENHKLVVVDAQAEAK